MREGEKWDVRLNIDLSTFGHSRWVAQKSYDNFVALNALCNDTWMKMAEILFLLPIKSTDFNFDDVIWLIKSLITKYLELSKMHFYYIFKAYIIQDMPLNILR